MNILIVDDDQTNRKLLSVTLGAEGYRTMEAADGVDALYLLETEPIDVVISDVLMPNMDGYRLCAAVRQCKHFDVIPFLFYTSTYVEISDEKLALGFGADGFLRKPVPAEDLLKAIEQLLAKRLGSSSVLAPTEELLVM